MCMFQCPVYSVHRKEVYSSKGKINAIDSIINLNKNDLVKLSDIFRECNLCGHCTKICPGELETPKLVIQYRNQLNNISKLNNYEYILNNIKHHGHPYVFDNSEPRDTLVLKKNNKGILLFLGCTSRLKLPERIINSVRRLLDNLGISYTILEDEPCCGNILHNLGYIQEAEAIAKKNRAVLNKFNQIITICPGCYNMFKNNKKSMFSKYEVFHILEIIKIARDNLKSNEIEPIFFQVPCHIYNSNGKFEKIIPDILPLFGQISSSLDVTNSPKCCGAGGGMLLYDKEYVKKRIDILLRNESAEKVVTACPFCYLNFEKNTSKDISFITEKLEVIENTKIKLKGFNEIVPITHNKEEDKNAPLMLIKYKVSSKLKKIFCQ